MLVVRNVISGPYRRVPLYSRVTCPGQVEGSPAIQQGLRAFVCTARHLESIHVPAAAHGTFSSFERQFNILRQHVSPGCNFIHVVPKTPDAKGCVGGELLSPPVTRFFISEVGEVAPPGPYLPAVWCSVGVFDEGILLEAFVIRFISGFDLYARIANYHYLKTEVPQLLNKFGGVDEVLLIPCEDFVLVHVVDIEHDDIRRNILFAKCSGHAEYFHIRIIAVTALLIAYAPAGRQVNAAGEPGIVIEDTRDGIVVNEIVRHLSGIGRKTGELVIGRAEIEERLMGVVEKNAVGELMVDSDVKRCGAVQWVSIYTKSVAVCVPVLVSLAAFVNGTGLLTEPDKPFIFLKRLIGGDLFSDPACSKVVIRIDDLIIRGHEGKTYRIFVNAHLELIEGHKNMVLRL